MNNGDIIISGDIQYKVIDKLGAGGQGSVYLVESQKDKQKYALKLINDKSSDRKANKIANIKHLVNAHIDADVHNACVRRGAKVNHTFPLSYFEDTASGTAGYIMECASGKTLGKLLAAGEIAKMKFEDKLKLIKAIAHAIDVLHDIGYCYTDISFGNFMWDSNSETLSVIDCENVASQQDIDSGKNQFLIGTGFFIAPEVAFKLEEQSRVSRYSDRYALATLFFCILTNGLIASPYHGKAMFAADPIPQSMQEVAECEANGEIDKNWRVFIFDPANKSNSIDDLFRNSTNPRNIERRKELDEATRLWNALDTGLKKLFYRAFSDPFDYKSRPIASQWAKEILE